MANKSEILTWVAAPEIEEAEKDLGEIEEMDDAIDDMMAEGFEVALELEEELVHDYPLTTPFEPSNQNLEEYRMRYNMACKAAEQRGDMERVADLVDIRLEAKRHGMENMPLILEVSPYTDDGAALCYGYVGGSLERIVESENMRKRFEEQYVTMPTLDGEMRTIRVS